MDVSRLPKIIIAGTTFAVDASAKALIQCRDTGNIIPKDHMSREYGMLSMRYDKTLEKPSHIRGNFSPMAKNVVQVLMPESLFDFEETPDFITAHLLNHRSWKDGWGIVIIDSNLQKRMDGRLPEVNIAGHWYGMDVENRKFRSITRTQHLLDMNEMELTEDGRKLGFLYDPSTLRVVDRSDRASDLPTGTALVEINDLTATDPVGMARLRGLDEGAYVSPERLYFPFFTARLTSPEKASLFRGTVDRETSITDPEIRSLPKKR